jgi:hypothetical protein
MRGNTSSAGRSFKLCDAAIRGAVVTRSEAEAVIDIADVLASEYLDWLGWGFPSEQKHDATKPD